MPAPISAARHADLSGHTLGGYRLLRPLGSGAMADVYLAEQESLARQVAVKVLRPETLRHAGAVERFSQEARAAAALVHGNIVQIHEVACVAGLHFLAEEYVPGPSLKAWLAARGPIDAAQALSVLSQVGSALAKASQAGIVHRDIKPDNLLVTPAGEVKVADFGLARLLEDDLELTQHGTALGTPLYMSPEQAAGRPVDTRSDLYSLGATVYHLLTGNPPFTGSTTLALALAHQQDPVIPLASVRPELPAGLGHLVEQLLAKQPDDRCETVTDFLHAVETVEQAVAGTSRHGPQPLAWDPDTADWRAAPPILARPWSTAPTVASSRFRPQPSRIREATRHLQEATNLARARQAVRYRDSTRRAWLLAIAAAVAFAAGLVAGRFRTRKSDLFRPRVEPGERRAT